MGFEARILALRLEFGPQNWDLGHETEIQVWRLVFKGGGCRRRSKTRRRRKFPICVKAQVVDPFGIAAQKVYITNSLTKYFPITIISHWVTALVR